MIADREECECLDVRLGCERVESSCFHLDGEDTVFAELVVVDLVVIEAVDRDDVADRRLEVELLRVGNCLREQVVVSNRAVVDGTVEDIADDGGVRAGRLGNQHIAQMDIRVHGAAGADAEELLAAEFMDELMHVDRDGRDAHARALDRYGNALVGAREAEDIADGGVLLRIVEEVLGDELGAQRVARQQDALSDLALFGSNMWCAHG